MKKPIICAVWTLLLTGSIIFVNCSNPLESSDLAGTDPVPSIDTLFSIDTLHTIDTLTQIDTLTIIDTITIIEPGIGESQIVCGRISTTQKDLVWMFRNPEGTYNLEFTALTDRDKPAQELALDIDGQEFLWNPGENPELITELILSQNAVFRITTNKPPSLGHAIDICLSITAH
ncbi:MAG: hypothetical protein V3V99_06990 [candidate division Zixibacteria bacterium]